MYRKLLASAAVAGTLLLAGCGHDDAKTNFQAVHASKDAPLANVIINGKTRLSGVDYGVASGYLELNEGLNTVRVDVQLPANATATVISPTVFNLSEETKYTVLVVGEANSSSSNPVEALVVTRPSSGSASASSLDVQVVHAAAGVPDVDLYVTTPTADINSESPLGTLAFKADTGVVNIANGDYRIRLTLSGTKTVVFDSGTVTLAPDSELTIAAITNTNEVTNSAPVKLVLMDGSSSSFIYDSGEQAQLRVGHLVYDAPVVDAALNGSEAISNLSFKDISSPYANLAAASYGVTVYAGDDPAGSTVINAPGVALGAGLDYSIYAIDLLASIEPLVITDQRRSVATSAVLNVLHAAQNPAAASVDIYLTSSTNFLASDPALEDFAYKQSAQGIYVTDGSYYVTVTAANDPTAVIGPAPITVEAGKVYQAIAISDSASTFDLLVGEITE